MKKICNFIFILASMWIMFLNIVVLQISYTSGSSMSPTIKNNDTLIMNKVSKPHRGDIVSVYSPKLDKYLCKRIIGMEGDIIRLDNGTVYVNDVALDEDYLGDDAKLDTSSYPNMVVGEGEIYVLGDNRRKSTDSRYIGCLNLSDVKGVLISDLGDFGVSKKIFLALYVLIFSILLLNLREVKSNKSGDSVDKTHK